MNPQDMNFTKLDTNTDKAESVMKQGPVPDIVNDPVYTQFKDLWENFRGDGSTEGTKKTLAKRAIS